MPDRVFAGAGKPEFPYPSSGIGLIIPLIEEFDAISEFLLPSGRDYRDEETYIELLTPGGAGILAVVLGTQASQVTAALAAEHLATRGMGMLAVVGIAGTLSADAHLADVVAPNIINLYRSWAKAVPGAGVSFEFAMSGDPYRIENAMFQVLEDLQTVPRLKGYLNAWRSRAAKRRDALGLSNHRALELGRIEPRIVHGHLASGPEVAASTAFAAWLLSLDRLFKAIEMESGGVSVTAYRNRRAVPLLVLRGISDFADQGKSELEQSSKGFWRRLAAQNAADLLALLEDAGLLGDVKLPITSAADPNRLRSSRRAVRGGLERQIKKGRELRDSIRTARSQDLMPPTREALHAVSCAYEDWEGDNEWLMSNKWFESGSVYDRYRGTAPPPIAGDPLDNLTHLLDSKIEALRSLEITLPDYQEPGPNALGSGPSVSHVTVGLNSRSLRTYFLQTSGWDGDSMTKFQLDFTFGGAPTTLHRYSAWLWTGHQESPGLKPLADATDDERVGMRLFLGQALRVWRGAYTTPVDVELGDSPRQMQLRLYLHPGFDPDPEGRLGWIVIAFALQPSWLYLLCAIPPKGSSSEAAILAHKVSVDGTSEEILAWGKKAIASAAAKSSQGDDKSGSGSKPDDRLVRSFTVGGAVLRLWSLEEGRSVWPGHGVL